MRKSLFILLICLNLSALQAQNIQFSQPIVNGFFINPAMTGGSSVGRFMLTSRSQWLSINAYSNYLFHYDHNFLEKKYLNDNIAFGLTALRDVSGDARYYNNGFNFSMSVQKHLEESFRVKFGISTGYHFIGFDPNKLILSDQLYTGSANTVEPDLIFSRNFLNFHSGLLISSSKWSLGVSAKNINRPNVNLINGSIEEYGLNWHTLFVYNIFNKGYDGNGQYAQKLRWGAYYKSEERFDQFETGFHYYKNDFGYSIWYRGIPFKKIDEAIINNESIVFGFYYKFPVFDCKLSYDLTLSRLYYQSGNTIELSIIYAYPKEYKVKKRIKFECPMD